MTVRLGNQQREGDRRDPLPPPLGDSWQLGKPARAGSGYERAAR
jgi:hypothetical protein